MVFKLETLSVSTKNERKKVEKILKILNPNEILIPKCQKTIFIIFFISRPRKNVKAQQLQNTPAKKGEKFDFENVALPRSRAPEKEFEQI